MRYLLQMAPTRTSQVESFSLEAIDGRLGNTQEPDYIERNRAAWDSWAPQHVAAGRKAWRDSELHWGIWDIPETKLQLMGGIEPDADVIELGCGTAEISAWLARQGIRPVAIDLSQKQLLTVESFQREFKIPFPALCANAEAVFYEDASFDLAISEYGASLWCDAERWLPEANRLLRPGGGLIFFTNTPMLMACTPEGGGTADARLHREHFTDSRYEFDPEGSVEFHLTHGHWIRQLRRHGFVVENLIEVRAPQRATPRYRFVSHDWARRWPSEEIWVARKAR